MLILCLLVFYSRHDNLQYLESMKGLVLFVERKLDEKVDKHVLYCIHSELSRV